MNIKRNLLFFIDKEGTKEKGYKPDGKLRLRIRYNKNKVDFNVGYRVDIDKWNTEVQRCKPGTSHGVKKIAATEINREIQRLEDITNDAFKAFEIQNKVPTTEEFRNCFNNITIQGLGIDPTSQQTTISFFKVFDEFVRECGIQNNWTEATYEKFAATRNHLLNFDPNINFEVLNDFKLSEYINFLRDIKNMRNSTIGKQLGFLKWFLKWAKKKGYNENNDFETYKPKLKTTQKKVIFLTWEELSKLREVEIPEQKKYLDRVRDVFLFQCFTGLRYSDVFNLKRTDVKDNYFEVTTIKTGDDLVIELNDFSRKILEKYKDIHFEKDKVLPVITNQKMNDYLKELAELAEINDHVRETYYKGNERIDVVTPKYSLLGTHAGRRTFICNALSLGIPPHVVMKWTGHSDYKAMKPYIDIADDIKANAMNKFNQLK